MEKSCALTLSLSDAVPMLEPFLLRITSLESSNKILEDEEEEEAAATTRSR